MSDIKLITNKSVIKNTTYYQFQDPLSMLIINQLITSIDNSDATVTKVLHNGDCASYVVGTYYVIVICNYETSRTQSENIIFLETKEYYETNIKPTIVVAQWVLNIFNGTANHETIYIDTETFIVMPDLKWDRKKENIYLLALSKCKDLCSLRDLSSKHISILKNISTVTLQYIMDHYGITQKYIRVFLHYLPSAWRLHIHFQHVSANTSIRNNIQVGKAHLLSTVIHNLELNSNYYRDITMECITKNFHM